MNKNNQTVTVNLSCHCYRMRSARNSKEHTFVKAIKLALLLVRNEVYEGGASGVVLSYLLQTTAVQQCMRNEWCTSTNYKMSSKKDSEGTCELNKHDVSLINENTNFLDQQDVTFSMLLKVTIIRFRDFNFFWMSASAGKKFA